MANIRAGDSVRIAVRDTTPEDLKTGLYFGYFRGLPGTVQKVYRGGEAAVALDLESLPEDVWKRHMNTRDQMRERWLQALPDDARRRLKPEQRQFDLRYVVLVSVNDLQKQRAPRARTVV